MRSALLAIALFGSFLSCSLSAAGQQSLDARLISAAAAGKSETVELLLARGANIAARGERGRTALMSAAKLGDTRTVTLLLKKGANIEAKDNDGQTALSWAAGTAFSENHETVQLLLDKGADIEAKDDKGETALFWAGRSQSGTEAFQLLLDRGANIKAKDNRGETPLHNVVTEDDSELVQLLLDRGADVEAKDNLGRTALHQAAMFGKCDAVQLLLDKGANIDSRDNSGQTPLFAADSADDSHSEAVQLLLNKGANIDARENNGDTALHIAALFGRSEMAQLLLKKGANIDVKDNDGQTALFLAARFGRTGIVALLLKQGAHVETTDNEGKTALSYVNGKGPEEMVDLLEQALRQRKQLELTQARDPRNRFAASVSAFQQNPNDDSLREKAIQLATALPEPPAIPEEARQLFVLASSQIKQASTPQALEQPIALLRKAVDIAPWWANAYYNLSRALELSGEYDEAARQLNYYLKLNPAEADAREARAHLVVIQTEKEAAAQKPQ